MRRRLPLTVLAAIVPLVLVSSAAWAFFTSSGYGTGSAPVGVLAAPTAVSGTPTGTSVAVDWTGITAPGTVNYVVTRAAVPSGSPVDVCGSPSDPLPATPTSCTDSPVAAGTYTYSVTALFRTWTATSAPSNPVVVTSQTTTTTLSLSPTSATYGTEGAVTFRAAVSSGSAIAPSGTVTIAGGGTTLCTITLPATTCAAGATALDAAGSPYTVTAAYSGDAENAGSSSTGQDLTVGFDSTTTAVTASPDTVTTGFEDTALLLATVTTRGGEALPSTGEQVSIDVGSAHCVALLVPGAGGATGACTIGASSLAVDATPWSVTAIFAGDGDLTGSSGSAASGLTVAATPTVITPALADATLTQTGYDQPIDVTGGTAPFSWSVVSGTLPDGLSLDSSSGTVSGDIGARATTETFTVQALDGSGATAQATFTLQVDDPPAITTSSLAPATGAEAGYSQTLTATGGAPDLSWAVTAGSLPGGLSLDPAAGTISGNINPGDVSRTFTVTLTDANGITDARQFTITVTDVMVQQMTIPRSTGNHPSFSVVLTDPVTAGDTLVLSVAQPCATSTGTLVNSPVTGASWDGTTLTRAVATGCSANGDAELWYLVGAASASGTNATTVTVTLAASVTVPYLSVAEYAGVTGLDPGTGATGTAVGATTAVGPVSCTPSSTGELVVSSTFVNRATLGTLATQVSPYVLLNLVTPYQGFGSYLIDPTTSPEGYTYLQSGPGAWSAAVTAFTVGP
jgi:hypothetical protein